VEGLGVGVNDVVFGVANHADGIEPPLNLLDLVFQEVAE
jgi:hypothetical protein